MAAFTAVFSRHSNVDLNGERGRWGEREIGVWSLGERGMEMGREGDYIPIATLSPPE